KYLSSQIRKCKVKIRLNSAFDASMLNQLKPEVVIVATGADRFDPQIPGRDKKNVASAIDVLKGTATVGNRVIVVGDGYGAEGKMGCEVAEFLAEKGHEVVLVEETADIGSNLDAHTRQHLLYRFGLLWKQGMAKQIKPHSQDELTEMLEKAHLLKSFPQREINLFTEAKVEEIYEKGVVINQKGVRKQLEADNVVLAIGLKPNDRLVQELKGRVSELYAIGDCVEPRTILNAIHEAAFVGRQI
ncbi:MAG: FAD-dependent oxidoreductase, partial [Promethearchaeota archaeon]